MNTKYLFYILSSFIILITFGCFTEQYYKNHPPSDVYNDAFISFLITEDRSKFVIFGDKYHYVFENSPILKQILSGPLKRSVSIKFENLFVTRDNVITGNYILWLSGSAPEEQKKSALEAGFSYYKKTDLTLFSSNIQGTRYSAEGFPEVDKRYKFNTKYDVIIREEQSAAELRKKVMLTPILVLADGVLVLGGTALFLFMHGGGVQ